MLGRQIVRKSISLVLTMALFFVSLMAGLAGNKVRTGAVIVRRQVSINGQTAVSNSTIFSQVQSLREPIQKQSFIITLEDYSVSLNSITNNWRHF